MITHEDVLKLMDKNKAAGKPTLECLYGYCKVFLEGMEAVENAAKGYTNQGNYGKTVEFNGTREEAIEIARKIGNSKPWYEDQISTLEALGLIKFKEEKKPLFKNDDIKLEWSEQQQAYKLYHRGTPHWFAK